MTTNLSIMKTLGKIWLIALFLNTLFGTAVVTDLFTYADIVGHVALIGLSLALFYSLPIVFALFVLLKILCTHNLSARQFFLVLLLSGQLLTIIAYIVFTQFVASIAATIICEHVLCGNSHVPGVPRDHTTGNKRALLTLT